MMGNCFRFEEHLLLLAISILVTKAFSCRKNLVGVFLQCLMVSVTITSLKLEHFLTALFCEWLFKLLSGATPLYF